MTRKPLTPTEETVARLVAEGLATPHVAEVLGLRPKTVETHLFRVYRKLGIRSRAELPAIVAAGAPLGRAASEDEPVSPFRSAAAPAITVGREGPRGRQSFPKVPTTLPRDSGRIVEHEEER